MSKSFRTYPNRIECSQDGRTQTIYITPNSGRLVTRSKLDTVFGVNHPGIILGEDSFRRVMVVHHHIGYQVPMIHTLEVYSDGEQVYYDEREVHFSQREIVENAMKLWASGANYNLFASNCQHFVTKAACEKSYSESVDRGIAYLIIALVIFLVLYVAYKTKDTLATLTAIGIGGLIINEILPVKNTSVKGERALL